MFANIGKAIAAYEKSLQHGPTQLDGYIDAVMNGDRVAGGLLRADEARGLRLFIGKAQCVSCHNGPLFSDQQSTIPSSTSFRWPTHLNPSFSSTRRDARLRTEVSAITSSTSLLANASATSCMTASVATPLPRDRTATP